MKLQIHVDLHQYVQAIGLHCLLNLGTCILSHATLTSIGCWCYKN